MQTSTRIGGLFGLGVLLLIVALFFQSVTLASPRYEGVLITALVCTILADVCFIQTFRLGGLVIRCLSGLFLLPTCFIVADFMRRAPYLFR